NLLFAKSDSTWATKRWFITKLKQLLPDENLAGHSFQVGGTTELVMHVTQQLLQQFLPKNTLINPTTIWNHLGQSALTQQLTPMQ
ncbi:6907_t:CDS:2, partial [Cetraspora pellucida]